MIYVTAGHEEGIGLEVFLKSYLLLPKYQQSKFHLICHKETLDKNLELCSISLAHDPIKTTFITEKPYSTSALAKGVELCTSEDVLLTLPTSKDQLILDGKSVAGHTEYFREFFKTEVDMFFKSDESNVLLVTDHIPLNKVSSTISKELIHEKTALCVKNYEKYFNKLTDIYITGINPHAGENGILGSEDSIVTEAISSLKKELTQNLHGPLPADGLLVNKEFAENKLFIYMYHDQGLAPFKSLYKTKGANISLGLPFLRLSVDHGTAFELYGKNQANYMGCYYVMKLALNALEVIRCQKQKIS
jgi:4-hydroxythreonine-4-phosphate dehydrogenase